MPTSVLLLLACCAAGAIAAEGAPAAADWRVEVRPGDRVELVPAADGLLRLRYDLAVDQVRQDGHQRRTTGGCRLLLARPRPVAAGEERLRFAAAGLDAQVQLRPLLADAGGEEFSYVPYAADLLLRGGAGSWCDWRSLAFASSEAGGAQNGIYDARGGDGNAWPDGALAWLGFELRVAAPAAGAPPARRRGEVVLGAVALAGARVDEGDPACFADALAAGPGRYRLAVEVRDAFQDLPVRESVQEFAYDPADPAQAGRRLRFDDAGLRLAWIRCRIERDGATVATWERRWERDQAPEGRRMPVVDAARAPVIGCLRLNPLADRGGVYAPGRPLVAVARVFPRDGRRADRLTWRLRPYAHQDVLAEGTVPLAAAGASWTDVAIALPEDGARSAWRLEVAVCAGADELDRQELVLGRARPPADGAPVRAGHRRTRSEVKASSYVRLTYLPPRPAPAGEAAALAHVREMLDRSAPLARDVTYMIDLAQLEVLPGVYDFAVLDRVMDAAADRGVGVTVRIAHAESRQPFRWHAYTRPRSWDGAVIGGHPYYGAYAMADEAFIGSWLRAFRALHDRYQGHAGFQGYYVMLPCGEWNVPDMPWLGLCSGYSWADRIAFRRFLQEEHGGDLAALDRRWGVRHAGWDAVQPPLPDLAAGAAPDRRLAWLDFCRFKNRQEEGWAGRAAAAIRAYDADRVIIGYSLDGGVRLDGLPDPAVLANVDYMHNGGNHVLQWEGALSAAWERGMGWITEPHDPHHWASYGDPSKRGWTLDWSLFVMTAQAGAGGANLHVYYWPNPGLDLVAHYGGRTALDRFQRMRPVLDELHGMRLDEPVRRVAVWQDPTTLFAKHRTVFAARRQDLRRWFEQLKDDAVPFEDLRLDHAAGYRLLVLNPLDEVVDRTWVETVDRLVREGATVLIAGRAGRLCPELSGDEHALLRRLGLPLPPLPWRGDEPAVEARAAAASALLPAGAAVPFHTRAVHAAELADPGLGRRFDAWPYRWLPLNDYLGRYPGVAAAPDEVLARFPDGGTALSVHAVGRGRAVVWWGTPSIGTPALAGFMQRLAAWCGADDARAGSPVPRLLEGHRPDLGRRYALLWQDRPGTYAPRLPSIPDGEWFVDDLISGRRLGLCSGAAARRGELRLEFLAGASPLQVLRFMPRAQVGADWVDAFQLPAP